MEVWSLASGSSGNAFLISAGGVSVLLDAGFPARHMCSRIERAGHSPTEIGALFLTHEHSDHASGAGVTSRALKIPVVANEPTLEAARRYIGNARTAVLPTGETAEIGELEVTSFRTSHDAAEPVGYVFRHRNSKVCYVTDTGILTPEITCHFLGAQLLILESNHDPRRLAMGPYPEILKRRIASRVGHLSNAAAATALAKHSEQCDPTVVWLAHLSEDNNTPSLAMECSKTALHRAGSRNVRLEVARRNVVSLRWESGENWWQGSLFG